MNMLPLPTQGWSTRFVALAVIALWQVIATPIDRCHAEGLKRSFNGTSYTTYRVDLTHQHLELYSKDDLGAPVRNAGALRAMGEKRGKRLIFATNAGIFTTSIVPLGLYVEQGKHIVPLNTDNGSGNFYMKPNGVFSITGDKGAIVSTQAFSTSSRVDYATQSGPILLERGAMNSVFNPHSTNRLVRSGVGIRGESEVYFAISNEPVSFYEFALLFRDGLGCTSALYLDGVISAMYAADLGRDQTSGHFAAMFALFEDLPGPQTKP